MACQVQRRIPVWAESGKGTEALFQWMQQGKDQMLQLGGYGFMKARIEDCLLLYFTRMQRKDKYGKIEGLNFCGIYNPYECALYDVSIELRQAAGIKDDIFFPTKQEVQEEARSRIQQYSMEKIQNDWHTLLKGSGYTTRQLLPEIDRTQIRKAAEQFFFEGKTAEEIVYVPHFMFGKDAGQFTDEIYLLYLNHKECVVRSFAERWLRKILPQISKERIVYGCIREEMRNIQEEQRDRRKRINEKI